MLTRLYDRVKAIQPGTSVRRVIATNIKEYLPRVQALLFTLFKEKKEGHRIRLAEGDRWFRPRARFGWQASRAADEAATRRSGGPARQRRNHGNAEIRRR